MPPLPSIVMMRSLAEPSSFPPASDPGACAAYARAAEERLGRRLASEGANP